MGAFTHGSGPNPGDPDNYYFEAVLLGGQGSAAVVLGHWRHNFGTEKPGCEPGEIDLEWYAGISISVLATVKATIDTALYAQLGLPLTECLYSKPTFAEVCRICDCRQCQPREFLLEPSGAAAGDLTPACAHCSTEACGILNQSVVVSSEPLHNTCRWNFDRGNQEVCTTCPEGGGVTDIENYTIHAVSMSLLINEADRNFKIFITGFLTLDATFMAWWESGDIPFPVNCATIFDQVVCTRKIIEGNTDWNAICTAPDTVIVTRVG